MALGMALVGDKFRVRVKACMVHRVDMLRRVKDWVSRVVIWDILCSRQRVQRKDSSSKDRASRLRRRPMRGRRVASSSSRDGVGG